MTYTIIQKGFVDRHEGGNMQYAGIIIHCFPHIPLMNLRTTGLVLEPPEQHTKNP